MNDVKDALFVIWLILRYIENNTYIFKPISRFTSLVEIQP